VSGCLPGSESFDASFDGEPVSRVTPNSRRASGVGVLLPWVLGDVTAGGESSPEWKGLPTRVRNWYTSEAESRNRWS
jgi:hypothetical protein